jgi:hypothetical protein
MIPFLPAYQTKVKYLACPLMGSGHYDLLDPDTGDLVQSNVMALLPPYNFKEIEFLQSSDARCMRFRGATVAPDANGPVSSAGIWKLAVLGGLSVYLAYRLVQVLRK